MGGNDPDLKPVPAAQAFLDTQGQRPAQPARQRPVITPAEPERWSAEVALDYPLLVDGVRLDRLTLQRLTAHALMDILMEDDEAESVNRRARAAIAGVDPDVLDALEGDDATRVLEAIRPFLPRALLGAEVLELAAAAAQLSDAAGA